MKKILSIFLAMAMLFAFAAIPAMAAEETVDFTRETGGNIAYGIEITHISGTYYASTGSPATAGNKGKLTDGDVSDGSQYYCYRPTVKGAVAFRVDLGAEYNLSEVAIYTGSTRVVSIYATRGTSYTGADLITNQAPASITVNGVSRCKSAVTIEEDVIARYVTFVYDNNYDKENRFYEILVKGEPYVDPGVDVDFSAESNILAGKTITHKVGYYFSSSTPSEEKQYATDGDIDTFHSGDGRETGKTGSAVIGVTFTIDLGAKYLLDTFDIYLAKGQTGRSISLYTGTEVNEDNFIGTYTANSFANKINAGGKSADLVVGHFELPDYVVADNITVRYDDGWGFAYYEIAATGREVQEGEIIRDFTSANNLAYGKDNARVIGHFYDGWNPAANDLATDGDITTTKKCTGAWSGDVVEKENGDKIGTYYGSAIRIDLGAYYNLTELTLYTTTKAPSSLKFRSEDAFTTTGGGQSSSMGGYILNGLGGQLHENGFATVGKDDYELVTVNGTQVYQYSADLSNNEQPVRYLMVNLCGGEWTYNEIYVAGTPATGLAFAEGDFVYADGNVTAEVKLMNLTEEPATGNLYFAAYDENGALVGMKNGGTVSADAGATYSVPATTFAASAKATYVKAFYWANGTYAPIIADIICD